jgi:antitoxin component YwqK of YwqJK toxin-antitoxin module
MTSNPERKYFRQQLQTFYNDGKLATKSSFRNGKMDGEYRLWYADGNLCFRAYCKNGKMQGEYEERNNDGIIRMYLYYINHKIIDDKFSLRKKLALIQATRRFSGHNLFPTINSYLISDLSNIIYK